jgi:hypothetical protein
MPENRPWPQRRARSAVARALIDAAARPARDPAGTALERQSRTELTDNLAPFAALELAGGGGRDIPHRLRASDPQGAIPSRCAVLRG